MSIELHCPQCGKMIKAPDNAGGRYGKCPYCEGRVYIPTPPEQREEIAIAPVSDEDEERERKLRQETLEVEAAVAHESDKPPAGADTPRGAGVRKPEAAGEVVEPREHVRKFLEAMRDSKLDTADEAVATLKRGGARARDYVQGLMVDEMPLDVDGVPPPVLKGFLKSLVSRLS